MLTPQEVAERYSVTVESVWRWIRDGRLPAISLTKRNYRIRPADLEAFERRGDTTRAQKKNYSTKR
jgi:excisionase family DNA binding protein